MKSEALPNSTDVGFRFARYLLAMGVFLMPLLGIFDYLHSYYIPAFVKFISFFLCMAGYILSKNPKYEYMVCMGATIVLLLMSLTGAAFKMDSTYSIIWITILPALFCFLSGIRLGIIISSLYLLAYVLFYTNFENYRGRAPVDLEVWLHSVMAYLAVLLVSTLFKSEKLKDEQHLKEVAEKDYLTNVYNRRGFAPKMEAEIKRAIRYKSEVSLILFDVDYFKRVNDHHGHAEGDKLLIKLMELVLPQIRSSDIIARWGGEEFIILTPESNLDAAKELAEKLRVIIEAHNFPIVKKITASFGVTQYRPIESWDGFVDRADGFLYKAKQDGRNRVVSDN